MEKQTIIDPYKKICKNKSCQTEFQATRLNQQFCNTSCKSEHNNAIARESSFLMKKVLDQIKSNRNILEDLYSMRKLKINQAELDLLKFDFNRVTGFHTNPITSKEVFEYLDYNLELMTLDEYKIGKQLMT